ncbi:hypothetical protein PWR63_19355 [Paraburkholderia sp. A2WS-5]|uniref:hypothetical protein n=1 Tax=unclassified Paraburkholderia TaxID=2615204 RepID=UPI003B7674C9
MQSLLSKVAAEQGCVRRITIDNFGNFPAVAATDGTPATPARDGAAFVLAETSPEAVAEYASLREHGNTAAQAFAQAFGAHFAADQDVTDLYAAAALYDACVRTADFLAVPPSVMDGSVHTDENVKSVTYGQTSTGSAAYAMNAAEAFAAGARANQSAQ